MLGIYFSPKPQAKPELKDLVSAANEVAKTARDVLTAMLVVALTLAATMIAATDEALLRDSAEVFPGLGAKVKLSTVFLLAPIVFAFLHANALLQLHLLAGRVRALDEEMKAQGLNEAARKPWRRMIHGFAFAQLLAGDDSHGGGLGEKLHRALLAFVSWLTIVVVPVALLVCAQVSFVRYQSDIITHVHQGMVGLDLALLLWFHLASWGRVTGAANTPARHLCLEPGSMPTGGTMDPGSRWRLSGVTIPRLASGTWSAMAVASIAAIVWLCGWESLPPRPEEDAESIWRRGDNLPATFSDRTCRWPGWNWTCRYLDLSNRTLVENDAKPNLLKPFADDSKLKIAQRKMVALDLSERNFRFGRFIETQLFSSDLSRINAEKSIWPRSHLDRSLLYSANLQYADLSNADLQDSNLTYADMRLAKLFGAKFYGAILIATQLQGSSLIGTKFIGTYISNSNFNATSLSETDFRGASLSNIEFQGAAFDLSPFEFFRPNLEGAYLQETDVNYAVGRAQGCGLALVETSSSLPIERDNLATRLKGDGLSDKQIVSAQSLIDKGPALECNGISIGKSLRPHPDAFAKARIDAACTHTAAARSILKSRLPQPYSNAFNKAWDAAKCPAVMAVKRERGEVQ